MLVTAQDEISVKWAFVSLRILGGNNRSFVKAMSHKNIDLMLRGGMDVLEGRRFV